LVYPRPVRLPLPDAEPRRWLLNCTTLPVPGADESFSPGEKLLANECGLSSHVSTFSVVSEHSDLQRRANSGVSLIAFPKAKVQP
jgi:hypothetical protein